MVIGPDRQVEMALRQLRRCDGPLSEPLESKVRALPLGQLEALGEALLDFSSLADLKRWLKER